MFSIFKSFSHSGQGRALDLLCNSSKYYFVSLILSQIGQIIESLWQDPFLYTILNSTLAEVLENGHICSFCFDLSRGLT